MDEQQQLNNNQQDESATNAGSGAGDHDGDENRDPSPNDPSSNDNELSERTSLDNICYDLLERILDFSDVNSLLNVADACKRLQNVAIATFRKKHGNKPIRFFLWGNSIDYYDDYNIDISGLKLCLPFVRCFGAEFSELTIHTGNSVPISRNNYLDQYINNYCADTLTSIRFFEKPSFQVENFPKPFNHVKDVFIGHSVLGQQLPIVRDLFPNVHQLVLFDISIDEHFTAISFPHLVDLAMNDYQNFTINGLLNLLHANRQLKCFQLQLSELHQPLTMSALSNMIAENPLITKLMISTNHFVNVKTIELWQFANERPTMIDLNLMRYVIPVSRAIIFIRQMQALQKFSFKLRNRREYEPLVDQLDNGWQHNLIFNETNLAYPLNNVVNLKRIQQ